MPVVPDTVPIVPQYVAAVPENDAAAPTDHNHHDESRDVYSLRDWRIRVLKNVATAPKTVAAVPVIGFTGEE